MKYVTFVLIGLIGVLTLAACTSASGTGVPAPIPSITPQATAEKKSLPTPAPGGQTIMYKDLQVTMDQAEITESYETEFGSSREPTAGIKFLWVHIVLKNIGQQEQNLPAEENFSALLGTTELKPTYGYRKDHTDYITLNTIINAGEEMDAWLRFDVPLEAESKDLTFVFLPESTQISFGFSSTDFSWADHPIYLWSCAP